MEKLKSCPFCGGAAKSGIVLGRPAVYCTACAALLLPSPYSNNSTVEAVVSAWNRRAETWKAWKSCRERGNE